MLSGLDETLMHQGPLPFAQALLSDHRFYDRYVLTGFRRDGFAGTGRQGSSPGWACTRT